MSSTAVAAVRAWILPAVAAPYAPNHDRDTYTFPWSLGFVEETRIIPQRATDTPGAMGDATFRLLRINREENGVTASTSHNVISGAYCCITRGMGDTFESSADGLKHVDWWGWIGSVSGEQFQGTLDLHGTVEARGLGHLLDGTVLTGFHRTAGGGYPTPVNTPPTANFSLSEGIVTGNARLSLASSDTGQFGGPVFAFAGLTSDCGTQAERIWTRWRLLLHVLAYCRPATFPAIRVACADGSELFDPTFSPVSTNNIAQTLNDTTIPEVFDLRDLTLKGALDMLIPRSRGFGWQLQPKNGDALVPAISGGYWELVIFTYDADGKYAPQNPPENINLATLTDIKSVQVTSSTDGEYDEVVVQGEPIVVAATVGFPDGNLKPGWTAAQETLYRAGASAASDSDGTYAAWSKEKKIARNNYVRQSPLLERVYSSFVLTNTAAGTSPEDINRRNLPGDGTGALLALVPNVSWDGTAARVDDSPSRLPYLPTARILRTIPWPVGVTPAGHDNRDDIQRSNPDYWPLRVFRYLASPPSYEPEAWLDLLVRNANGTSPSFLRGTPAVSPDDRAPAIRIAYTPAETLAKAQWQTSDATSAMEAQGADPSTNSLALDYSSLVATIALASDQRLEVVITKPGLSAGSPGAYSTQARRRLVIRDSRLHCWFVPFGTILAVKADPTGTTQPDRVTSAAPGTTPFAIDGNLKGYLTRNDYPVAQRIATMTAAWAFQRRTSVAISRALTDATITWDRIGAMIGTLTEAVGQVLTVNTVVERIELDYSIESPSMTITTTLPERPDLTWKIGGGASPMGGGAVSVAGGGTLAQQVQDAKQATAEVARSQKRVPLIPAWQPGSVLDSFVEVKITGGNTLADTTAGIKYVAGGVASVPSAYDPSVTTSFIDGIGRGQLFINGSVQAGYVLVVLDNRSTVVYALKGGTSGEYVATPSTVQIPVDGTSPVEYITCYVPVWV